MSKLTKAQLEKELADLWCRRCALMDALEVITSTAKEVKASNTPEFMAWIKQRAELAEKAWDDELLYARR